MWPEHLYWSPAQGEACSAYPGSTLFIIGVDNLGRQCCRPKPAHGIVFVFKSRRNVPYLKLTTFIDNPAAFLTFTVLNASFVESQNVFIAPKGTSDVKFCVALLPSLSAKNIISLGIYLLLLFRINGITLLPFLCAFELHLPCKIISFLLMAKMYSVCMVFGLFIRLLVDI